MDNVSVREYKYLRLVQFKDFSDWNIRNYFLNQVVVNEKLVPMGCFVKQIQAPISKKSVAEKGISIISKISFGGELFLRPKEEVKTYKGNVSLVTPNQFIFSKIRARNGCIYFHNQDFEFAVSSEYPILQYDENLVNGDYLKMILRSNYFKQLLANKSTGGAKARMTAKEISLIKIPLPILSEQEGIVAAFKAAQAKADNLSNEVFEAKIEIEKYVNVELGISEEKTVAKKGLQFIRFKNIEKWGIDFVLGLTRVTRDKYPTKKIGAICKIGSGGTPSRKEPNFFGGDILWVKTAEVKNNIIRDTEEKITKEGLANSSAKIYPAGSLLMAMYGQGLTRGRTAKLAVPASTNQACAVMYDIDNDQIETDFLWLYLQNEYNRLRELASGNNQPNLNADMVYNYEVVIPPLTIQTKIMEKAGEMRAVIKLKKAEAKTFKLKSITEFEQKIFGES